MKKVLSIISIVLIICSIIFSIFCFNVYAEESTSTAKKMTPTLTQSDGCETYYIENGVAYALYQDKENITYYVLDGYKPYIWNDQTKYQQIIIQKTNPYGNGIVQGMFIYDFKEETLIDMAKVYTVTQKMAGVGPATEAILVYSDDNQIFKTVGEWTAFNEECATITTTNTEKHRYWGVRVKSAGADEFMSVTEFELYQMKGNIAGGGTGTVDKEYQDGIFGWFQKLFDKITEIPTKLEDIFNFVVDIFKFNSGKLIFDKAGEMINENLKGNKFFTSINSIKDSLTSLYNEDYTSRTGFYELGLTNITLRKPKIQIAKNFGNETIGDWEQDYEITTSDIDYGLENAKVLNLDWFFGKDIGDGYYTIGLKRYTDKIVGAFMWVMFAWALFKNLPNWISGELTEVKNLGGSIYQEIKYKDIKVKEKLEKEKLEKTKKEKGEKE